MRREPPGRGWDPLQFYVTMVALSCFHRSHAHTLSVLLRPDLLTASWLQAHHRHAREVVRRYLEAVLQPGGAGRGRG